jgi:alanine racemase
MEMKSRTAMSLRMGLVGNWRQIVFYGRRLSSLSSMSATDETPEMLRSWVEVDLAVIRRNFSVLSEIAGPVVKIMAVVKANAYGHGAAAVAGALAGRAAMFGVANLAEAEEIRAHALGTPICLLSGTLPGEHAAIVRRGYIPVVSSFDEAAQYGAHCSGSRVKVHLAIDTGMGRLGVREQDAVAVARKIMELPGIELAGIGSHLPLADEDPAFTQAQLTRFHALVAQLRDIGLRDALVHVENSAALLAFPGLAGALARPGLALYGESPLPEFQSKLERALTWKTRVVLVRDFEKGRGVSYGRTFITPGPMRIATLATGYADGYPRQLSGRGATVLLGGRRCAVLGRVTMDQIMVDATGVDASQGDEAVLVGPQGAERITATELANLSGTIPWDIFTGIGLRVARLYRGGDSSASPTPIHT